MISFLAVSAQQSQSFSIMLHALWVGFRWPIAIILGWICVKAFIGPVFKAIGRMVNK